MHLSSATSHRFLLTLLSIPIIGYFPNSAIAFFKFTSVNKALVGFAYQTAENGDWIHCIQACQQDSSCISYNFRPGMFGRRCELNSCGFEDECSAKGLLMWVPGWIFQQLRPIQDATSKCNSNKVNTRKNKSDVIYASFSCSEKMTVYADGKIALMNSTTKVRDITCSELDRLPINFFILKTTQVVAIEVVKGTLQVIGSFTDSIVTDARWKCNATQQHGWYLADFDDSHWKPADEVTGTSTGGTDGQITGVLSSAKWIKTAESDYGQKMYCRLHRKIK